MYELKGLNTTNQRFKTTNSFFNLKEYLIGHFKLEFSNPCHQKGTSIKFTLLISFLIFRPRIFNGNRNICYLLVYYEKPNFLIAV